MPLTDEDLASLPFPEAQAALAGPPESDAVVASVGWHGTKFDPRLGAYGIVRSDGPLAHLVGERVRITYRTRSVIVYIHDEGQPIADLSLTRRTFMALSLLPKDTLRAGVEVVASITEEPTLEDVEYATYTNLVLNPHGENDLTGWDTANNVFPGAVMSRVADASFAGTHVVRSAVTASGTWWGVNYEAGGSGFFQSGVTYQAVFVLKGEAGGEALQLVLGQPGQWTTPNITLTNDWAPYVVSWTPAGNAAGHMTVRTQGSMTGAWRIGGVLLLEGFTPVAYFDGDSASAMWLGTPHASQSQKLIVVP